MTALGFAMPWGGLGGISSLPVVDERNEIRRMMNTNAFNPDEKIFLLIFSAEHEKN